MEEKGKSNMDFIFNRTVKAGKRVYFFDVRENRRGNYYLTITESKKRFNADTGKIFFEKHKVFLHKEDFEKFTEGFLETIDFIKSNQEVVEIRPESEADRED